MSRKQLNWAVISGHMVECFDATIYGFYAVTLASYFFPPGPRQVLWSYAAFLSGFISRPLGALLFGFLGDKYGRQKPLLASMAFVGVPTILIGILPTYDQIGLWAPWILFFCRFSQGVLYGAEFAGVSIYTFESYETTGVVGAKTGILVASGIMGAALATGLGVIFTLDALPSFVWRVPFVCGGLAAFAVFFWRRRMCETPAFEKAQRQKTLLDKPTAGLMRYLPEMFVALLIVSLNTMPLYLITVFGNHMFRDFGYTSSESMAMNTSALVFGGLLIMFCGRLADRLGFERLIVWGCIWMILVAVPSFYLLYAAPSVVTICVFMMLILIGDALVSACTMPYIATFFPTNCRFSAVALSTALGAAFIAGPTPFLATFLIEFTGLKIAPAFWLVGVSIITLYGIYRMKRKKTKDLVPKTLDFAPVN